MMNELNEMYIRRRNKVMVCDKPINCTEDKDKNQELDNFLSELMSEHDFSYHNYKPFELLY